MTQPAPPAEARSAEAADAGFDDCWSSWRICGEHDASCIVPDDFDAELPGAAPVGPMWGDEASARAGADHTPAAPPAQPFINHSSSASSAGLPSSPAALLRYLQSTEYRDRQAEMARRVCGSFTLHHHCPWVLPKPVLLLALRRAPGGRYTTYTLLTSAPQGVADSLGELAAVLGSPRLADALSLETMQDGVVCFERAHEAAQYQQMLEADGYLDVVVTEVDSHELFRTVTTAKGVVVLMGQGDLVPTPAQLTAALRRKQAIDDL